MNFLIRSLLEERSDLGLHCFVYAVLVSNFRAFIYIIYATTYLYLMGLDMRKPVYAYAQSDQHLCYSLIGKYHIWTCLEQNLNSLASLYTGLSLALWETRKTGFLAVRPR